MDPLLTLFLRPVVLLFDTFDALGVANLGNSRLSLPNGNEVMFRLSPGRGCRLSVWPAYAKLGIVFPFGFCLAMATAFCTFIGVGTSGQRASEGRLSDLEYPAWNVRELS